MTDIVGMSPRQLLKLYADIEGQLRSQKIITTANKPTGDYAEFLFRVAFGWKPAGNSQKGFDAIGPD
jgi:hypothetical protein